jgi:CheY-like chemotaxis protein
MVLHILVVEDNDDCAMISAAVLRHFGHTVQIARDGSEALEACRIETPDVVLLDLGMPGMNGYELAERLREEFGEETPLLIAVTGYGDGSDRQHTAAVGIDVHLVKPVDFKELNSLLSTLHKAASARRTAPPLIFAGHP